MALAFAIGASSCVTSAPTIVTNATATAAMRINDGNGNSAMQGTISAAARIV